MKKVVLPVMGYVEEVLTPVMGYVKEVITPVMGDVKEVWLRLRSVGTWRSIEVESAPVQREVCVLRGSGKRKKTFV